MRSSFSNSLAARQNSQRQGAIAAFAKTTGADALLQKVADGDFGAADKIAQHTGVRRIDVLAFVQDAAEAKAWDVGHSGAPGLIDPHGNPLNAGANGLSAGGTVAHLTGFKQLVSASGESLPLNTLTGIKPAPSDRELLTVSSMILRSPLSDQHAHEIGSAPAGRVGKDIGSAVRLPLEDQKQFLDGINTEIGSITAGGKNAFVVNALDASHTFDVSEVIASPPAENQIRKSVSRTIDKLHEALFIEKGPQQIGSLRGALRMLDDALGTGTPLANIPPGLKQAVATSAATTDPRAAVQALEPFGLGVLNEISIALTAITGGPARPVDIESAEIRLATAVLRLRNSTRLQKPDNKKWGEVSAKVNGALEFFVRYKSVMGTHAGAMDGAGVAEVALTRDSNVKAKLGYQELRVDLDTDRFRRRFDVNHSDGMLEMDELALASQTFVDDMKGGGVDAFMTYALTKRETVSTGDDEEALIEAPLYAKQAAEFVGAYFEGGPGASTDRAKTLQAGMNGIDHGGRESPERAPMLFLEAHGTRVVYNTQQLHAAMKNADPKLQALISMAVDDPALLSAWSALPSGALDPASWAATAGGKTLHPGDLSTFQKELGELGPQSVLDWSVDLGGISVEDASRVNRAVLDSMRTHAALTGTTVDIPQMGATIHTGEQIQSCPPDVLLDQVAQSLAMGADRLGHGVILGTNIRALYERGDDGKMWPKMLSAKKRLDPKNAPFSKTPAQVAELESQREKLVDRVITDGVVIEMNLTSNLVINDQRPQDHPMNIFGRKMHEGLRFTVNTDDETILATTIQKEMIAVQKHLKMDAVDTTQVMLEAYRSRLGGAPLKFKDELVDSLAQEIETTFSSVGDGRLAERVQELSQALQVPTDSSRNPNQQLRLVMEKVLA